LKPKIIIKKSLQGIW